MLRMPARAAGVVRFTSRGVLTPSSRSPSMSRGIELKGGYQGGRASSPRQLDTGVRGSRRLATSRPTNEGQIAFDRPSSRRPRPGRQIANPFLRLLEDSEATVWQRDLPRFDPAARRYGQDQVTSVPEPATLVLLVTGVVEMACPRTAPGQTNNLFGYPSTLRARDSRLSSARPSSVRALSITPSSVPDTNIGSPTTTATVLNGLGMLVRSQLPIVQSRLASR